MARWQKLEIGLPFRVTALQAIQFFASQDMSPADIAMKLARAGVGEGSLRQAMSRARKLKLIERRKVSKDVGGERISIQSAVPMD